MGLALVVVTASLTVTVAWLVRELARARRTTAAAVESRQRAEEALRRREVTAEAASRAKSEFLANMSHEIRTPMNGVLGLTELVLDGELRTDQREHLELVRSSAESLLTILDDVLDFSKIEAGHLTIRPAPFVVRDCVSAAARLFAPRAQVRGLALTWSVDRDVPVAVLGDAVRLRQVLTNLLSNAVKFTPRGEVRLEVSGGDAPDQLRFVVRDTGIGLSSEEAARVFEPFVQADGSSTRRHGGTGLGLPISARLATLMGGRLTLDSTPGVGSCFTFTAHLPAASASARRVEAPRSLAGRALVADADPAGRRLLGAVLRQAGMEVRDATSGAEAAAAMELAHLAGSPFDVLVTDATLPDMPGSALVRRVRERRSGAEAAVVLLTTADEATRTITRDPRVMQLVRPVRAPDLVAAVGQALSRCHPAPRRPTRLRVLLAEDNAVNRRLATLVLERLGHEVVVATDGVEALAALQHASRGFDLALMDVQMPGLDGLEVTRRLREHERLGRRPPLPVLALTAHALDADRERCLAAGMDGYVSKPFKVSELTDAISTAVRSPAAA